jgi:hypothetical protein
VGRGCCRPLRVAKSGVAERLAASLLGLGRRRSSPEPFEATVTLTVGEAPQRLLSLMAASGAPALGKGPGQPAAATLSAHVAGLEPSLTG